MTASATASRALPSKSNATARIARTSLRFLTGDSGSRRIVASANAESARLIDAAHVEADRLRGECDIYVDSKLAEFE